MTEGIAMGNIYFNHPLRISVYFLPKGETMKLHDHPNMEVVNYILKGKMQADVFTHLNEDTYKK